MSAFFPFQIKTKCFFLMEGSVIKTIKEIEEMKVLSNGSPSSPSHPISKFSSQSLLISLTFPENQNYNNDNICL